MIWYYCILFVTSVFTAVFSFLPKVEVLPFGADAFLLNVVGNFNFIAQLVPPLTIMMQIFLVYMGFKVSLVILKFLRVYGHHSV